MCMNVDWLIDVATGERHVSWDGVPLPGLHKKGQEISLIKLYVLGVGVGKMPAEGRGAGHFRF